MRIAREELVPPGPSTSMKSYFQDPATMSDEELKVLSEELYDSYQSADSDGFEYWFDDEAEKRHRDLCQEIHRRFMLANPDWKPPEMSELMRQAMERIWPDAYKETSFYEGDQWPKVKIGDTISVRKPTRYLSA